MMGGKSGKYQNLKKSKILWKIRKSGHTWLKHKITLYLPYN